MNVVVVAAKQTGVVKHVPYLEHCEYKIHLIIDVDAAIDVCAKAKPDLVLLSWDIPREDITAAYREFSERLGIPCIVFSEDLSSRSLSTLARSRIPNVLLPPISGPSIHRRIQLLIRDKGKPVRETRDLPVSVRIAPAEVPKETVWESVGESELPGSKKWKGSAPGSSPGSANLYYYKGDKKPAFNGLTQQWENLHRHSLIIKTEVQSGDAALGKILDDTSFDEIRADEMELAHLKESVEKVIMDSAAKALKTSPGAAEKLSPNIVAVTLPSDKLKGYLLIGQDKVELDVEVLKSLYALLASKLLPAGAPPVGNSDTIGVGTDFPSFDEWAKAIAEISFHDVLDGSPITIAFMDGDELPQVAEATGEPYREVEFKDWLTPGTVMQFDLFIHLPANNKYILYLKKETDVTENTVERFTRLNVAKIFIDPADMKGFVAYCIQAKLKKDLKSAA